MEDRSPNISENSHETSFSGKDPLISMILPVFDREETVARAVESALSQTCPYFELIIINDGSTDGTGKVCGRYEEDPRVRIFTTENRGVSAARNFGIGQSRGEYICFLDSDDEYTCQALEELLAAYTGGDQPDLVIAGIKNDNFIPPAYAAETLSLSDFLSRSLDLSWQYLYKSPCGKLYRKDILTENSLAFDESMSYGEDICFNFRYYACCRSICFIGKEVYLVHRDPGDTSHLSDLTDYTFAEMMDYALKLKAAYRHCFSAVPESLASGADQLFLDTLWGVFSWYAKSAGSALFAMEVSVYEWEELLALASDRDYGRGYDFMCSCLFDKKWRALWRFFRTKRIISDMIPRHLRLRISSVIRKYRRAAASPVEGSQP